MGISVWDITGYQFEDAYVDVHTGFVRFGGPLRRARALVLLCTCMCICGRFSIDSIEIEMLMSTRNINKQLISHASIRQKYRNRQRRGAAARGASARSARRTRCLPLFSISLSSLFRYFERERGETRKIAPIQSHTSHHTIIHHVPSPSRASPPPSTLSQTKPKKYDAARAPASERVV